MKKMMSLLMMLFAVLALQAQDTKPQYQKDGDLVKATFFHDNGEIAQTGFFLEGKLHGEWKMFDAEGNRIVLGQYNEGQKTGKWFFWEESNLREVDYSDNAIVNVVNWNNGTKVAVNK